jgi:hypothetical protein
MNLQHQISPIPGVSNEELERFAAVIAAKVLPLIDKGDEVLTIQESADFLKCSRRQFNQLVSDGKIDKYAFSEGGYPRYLKSTLIEFVKRSKVS